MWNIIDNIALQIADKYFVYMKGPDQSGPNFGWTTGCAKISKLKSILSCFSKITNFKRLLRSLIRIAKAAIKAAKCENN